MKEILNFAAWGEWLRSLNSAWLFLLVLVIVIVVVGFWSRSLGTGNVHKSGEE